MVFPVGALVRRHMTRRLSATASASSSIHSQFAVNKFEKPAAIAGFHTRRSAATATTAQWPRYVANDATAVVAGVAIVGAIIGVGKMWWDASSSSSSATPSLSAMEFRELTRDDMLQFFTELTMEVQNVFQQLPAIENAMRTYMKDNNIELSDAEFSQAMLQQLFQMMEALEQQIVGKRQWSKKSLEHALEKYSQDPEVLALQQKLQKIMQSVFPVPEAVEVPEHLTAEKTLEILTILVNGMETAMKEMLRHAKSEGITDPKQAMEEFQHLYLEQVEQITNLQMQTHGISQQAFTAALQKFHQENEEFRKKVDEVYEQQAKAFRKLGLDIADQ